MKKKLISLLLVAGILSAVLVGCGNTAGETPEASGNDNGAATTEEGTAAAEDGEMPNLVVSYAYAAVPEDIAAIEAKLNEITIEKIGATVTLQAFTYGNINEQLTLILSSPSEQLDVMLGLFYGTGISGYVEKGQLQPLNDLLDEHGQGIKDVLGDKYLEAASIGGQVYGITTCRNLANQIACMFRKDIIDELGIDLSTVTSFDDLTPIFEQIHAAYPELYTTGAAGIQGGFIVNTYDKLDLLGDSLGVLMDYEEPVVSNLFESELYRSLVERNMAWNQAGYIYPDICTDSSTSVQTLLANGLAASYIQQYKPGAIVENENTVQNYELEAAVIGTPVAFTNSVQSWMYAIPANAVYPEKAMQFLNLLYTDADVVNLFSYGIEGTHYVVNDEGFATNGPSTEGYADKASWKAGNAYLSYVWEGDDADLYDQLKAWNESAANSGAMGFVMDNSSVSAEYTALQSVLAKYQIQLERGQSRLPGDVAVHRLRRNCLLYQRDPDYGGFL